MKVKASLTVATLLIPMDGNDASKEQYSGEIGTSTTLKHGVGSIQELKEVRVKHHQGY